MDNTPGERIRIAREALGWTQAVVAEKLGITIGTLSGYERNYRKPNLDMLRRLVTVLGVSADFILGLTDNPQSVHLLNVTSMNKMTDTIVQSLLANPSLLESYQDLFKREDLQLIHEYLRRLKPETIQKLLEVVKLINDSKQK